MPPPPSNFIVSCLIMKTFGVLIEFDKFFPKSSKNLMLMSKSSKNLMLLLGYPLKSKKFFISGPIWLRGRILGADFESEMIFHIKGQH